MKIAGVELPPLLADAARECRPHFAAALGFSALVNLLYLAPAIYMLQIYDRVVPTGGLATLAYITLALAIALLSLAALDAIRAPTFEVLPERKPLHVLRPAAPLPRAGFD